MARKIPKIKEPLILNGVDVRDLETLRENFNIAEIAEYAFNGSLIKFLRERQNQGTLTQCALLPKCTETARASAKRKFISIFPILFLLIKFRTPKTP